MKSDRETISVYDERAQEYAQITDNDNSKDPRLSDFIAACPANGTVLDLGCGPGMSASAMARAGLRVIATDASSEMVAIASQHPGVTAHQAVFDDLDEQAAFDGIWANFSLLHAPRADMPRHLAAIHRALKPGGAFYIGLKTGSGEKRDTIGRFYSYYTKEELFELLETAGFTVLSHKTGSSSGLEGTVEDWISVAARA